jgi:hypothetical protein
MFKAIARALTSDSGSANRTGVPAPEPRRQAPKPLSPARQAAIKHYERTGDSRPMWRAKSQERDAAWDRKSKSRNTVR